MAGGVAPGGQLTTTTDVENCNPWLPKGISGPDLTTSSTIASVDLSSQPKPSTPIYTSSLIIATGATARRMNLPANPPTGKRESLLCGMDGAVPIFRNKPLVVVGGGDSAAEEALFLTKYASKVNVLVRKDKLRASKVMADRLLAHPKVEVIFDTVAVEAVGDGSLLQGVVVRNEKTKQTTTIQANGLFYAIGHVPNTDFLKGTRVKLDRDGYVLVTPGTSETNIPGVFAAGDVQDRRYRQAITAAGSGCMAALDCERWLEANKH
ncbi:FAD/NAD(P)-binding domain-containing protein [Rhizoclosmatium globosum]|uniref:FAD/NAD(P)-binding domain-containing protein n=1 Tax=Rhizoclosmatium globosum TaxID=329046 RepID=A0A1Y2BUT5_9FUNG|nr:FAD/NAD(P)-binding domain-containing protein [Rhizoclosmatium globosum]|eukprot:ORY38519.1 FAD/NAD(P)-binding domain-containing protein [Rhizoclosmatium globosum]